MSTVENAHNFDSISPLFTVFCANLIFKNFLFPQIRLVYFIKNSFQIRLKSYSN